MRKRSWDRTKYGRWLNYPLKEDFRDLGVCSDEEGILGFLDD